MKHRLTKLFNQVVIKPSKKMTHLIPNIVWSILGQLSKLQRVVKYTHTSLMMVDKFFHLIFPHLSRKEPIKKIPLEGLPSQWTTP